MFTVEMDFDEIEITVLDDSGLNEDVKIFSYDDGVFIRQWNQKEQLYDVIQMTPAMYTELMQAWQSPEGAFLTNHSRNLK